MQLCCRKTTAILHISQANKCYVDTLSGRLAKSNELDATERNMEMETGERASERDGEKSIERGRRRKEQKRKGG